MNVATLQKYKAQLQDGQLDTDSVITEIGEDLLFASNYKKEFLTELNVFLNDLHRTLYKKGKLPNNLSQKMKDACILASAASNRKDPSKPAKDLGELLIEIAPALQVLIGVVALTYPEFKFSV